MFDGPRSPAPRAATAALAVTAFAAGFGLGGRVPAGAAGRPLYAALGDSFSSGEGVRPFEPGSDTGANRCHRSQDAYAHRFADAAHTSSQDPNGRYQLIFLACSGAVIDDLFTSRNDDADSDGPQVSRIPGPTQVISVTIGGNDAGFGPILQDCATPGHGDDCDAHFPNEEAVINRLEGKLLHAYARLKARAVRVYVLEYPKILPTNETHRGGCGDDGAISPRERTWLRKISDAMNAVIDRAAHRAGVTVIPLGDKFAGHEVCGSDPANWVDGIRPGRWRESFHPNRSGHQIMGAELVRRNNLDLP